MLEVFFPVGGNMTASLADLDRYDQKWRLIIDQSTANPGPFRSGIRSKEQRNTLLEHSSSKKNTSKQCTSIPFWVSLSDIPHNDLQHRTSNSIRRCVVAHCSSHCLYTHLTPTCKVRIQVNSKKPTRNKSTKKERKGKKHFPQSKLSPWRPILSPRTFQVDIASSRI